MKKEEIVDKLVELGIDFDESAKKDELLALLPEGDVDSADESEDGDESATVTWNGGSRVYTLKDHGKKYEDLAEQFAGKVGGVVS